ncbi:SGNH/GDSL hydrolase family protein [Alcanivorax sp.]|uniref:SGNH/GDSL hydrolase family protein n=1 Tax=Alcanivorax sp. TaxID=1872427 RepID=UPI0025C58DF9|nr:SGNH/GDSL hydrolase family protein [Alcanivorax sp.]
MHAPFWLGFASLAPLLLAQAVHTRRTTVRLPDGQGPAQGQWGEGACSKRLLVIGESTAASVGVEAHQEGLASQLARLRHQQSGETVGWHTLGVNGIRMDALQKTLAATPTPQADAIFISMGVNDTTGLTPRKHYASALARLITHLQSQQPGAPVYLLAVPPMDRFTALPSPLRQMLGWRARLLNQQHQSLARSSQNLFSLYYPPLDDPALLAQDGYHPGARGYQAMAEAILAQL